MTKTFGPYLPLHNYRANKSRDRERAKNALTVQPLPEQRPRALTLPLPEANILIAKHQSKFFEFMKKKKKVLLPQQTSNQEQCLLITRLPPESRLMIWQYVLLSNNRLHIVRNRQDGRISAISCEGKLDLSLNTHTCRHKCAYNTTSILSRGGFNYLINYEYAPDSGYVKPLFSVPMTCRLM
jgi:hypothetical protein